MTSEGTFVPRSGSAASLRVIGLGADGWDGLGEPERARIAAAHVVLGAPRHLALLPDVPGQRRLPWPSPLRRELPDLLDTLGGELDDGSVVALASGDPLVSGIGTTLLELLGAGRAELHPAVSSVALARARMGWPSETCAVVSAVGRDVRTLLRELAPGRRVLLLASDERTPGEVAALLDGLGYGASTVTVLGDLGGAEESRRHGTAAEFASDAAGMPRLHVLALELAGPLQAGWASGLPDEAYEHDGQLTKRDLRAAALARLLPTPGALLWDVGAGAGSVGIEWMRAHPRCRTVAIEAAPERAARIERNAGRLGVPGLRVVTGRAPDALGDLPRPDAIFVGGGATGSGVLDRCLEALRPGGRMVVHGVTLETEAALVARHAEYGGELSRISVEQVDAIGGFRGWRPLRPVTQWAWTRPG